MDALEQRIGIVDLEDQGRLACRHGDMDWVCLVRSQCIESFQGGDGPCAITVRQRLGK
jgi:hypothetical protein